MRIETIRFFVDTAEMHSVINAAKRNNISPQGLSRALLSMENELGCALFRRGPSSITPTHKGMEMLPLAKRVLASYDDMYSLARSGKVKSEANKIKVLCCSFVFIDDVLEQRLFDAIRADSEVECLQMRNTEIIDWFARVKREGSLKDLLDISRSLGVVMFYGPLADERKEMLDKLNAYGVGMKPYMEYIEHVLLAEEEKKRLLAEGRNTVSKQFLRERPLICSTGEQHWALERYLGGDEVDFMIESLTSRIKFVRELNGCAPLPPFMNWMDRYDTEGLSLLPLKEPYKVELAFIGDPEILDSQFCFELRAKLNEHYRRFEKVGLCRLL